jgi:hypothetical protein
VVASLAEGIDGSFDDFLTLGGAFCVGATGLFYCGAHAPNFTETTY